MTSEQVINGIPQADGLGEIKYPSQTIVGLKFSSNR